eukprot:sb/3471213/
MSEDYTQLLTLCFERGEWQVALGDCQVWFWGGTLQRSGGVGILCQVSDPAFFPLKESGDIDELMGTFSDTDKVNVKALFNTERDGNLSEFLKTLYNQFYKERGQYVKDLHTSLVSICGSDKKEYNIQDLCKAFEITDPEKNSKDVNKLLAKVFNLNLDQLSSVGPVDRELLLQRLKSSGLIRSGPKGV